MMERTKGSKIVDIIGLFPCWVEFPIVVIIKLLLVVEYLVLLFTHSFERLDFPVTDWTNLGPYLILLITFVLVV